MEHNTSGNKGRILFLQRYLLDHTDDDHIITTEELIQLYDKEGYKANRATIRDDIAMLLSFGMDIISDKVTRNGTKTNAYHIGERLFELAELKMLVDAVASSRFITRNKSEQLIEKLIMLTNEENRETLKPRIHVCESMKTSNTNVLFTIDTVCHAVDNHRKVSFRYYDFTSEKKKALRHNGEVYTVSPYALTWNDDRYYLIAYSDKREKNCIYRVDRICEITELTEQARIDPTFDPADYSKRAIKLFDDGKEETRVILLCKNELMKNVIDRFGEDIITEVMDQNTFTATIRVYPSSTFFGWITQYKGGIVIKSPIAVRDEYDKLLSKILRKQTGMMWGCTEEFPEE